MFTLTFTLIFPQCRAYGRLVGGEVGGAGDAEAGIGVGAEMGWVVLDGEEPGGEDWVIR